MDIIKLFVDNEENIEINIQGTIDEPLFQANQIGKLLDIKQLVSTIRDFDDDEKVMHNTHTLGGNQDVLFLTEIGLYRLLGMSRKEKARKFQKWIATVVKEIRLNGKYELEKSLKETIDNHKAELEKQRHDLLIKKWENTPGVYIGKVKELDDTNFIIKIGNTIDIKERAGRHKIDFGNFILLDFFDANRHIKYEQSLYKLDFVLKYKYIEDINGVVSNETFCITKDIYRDLIQIIEKRQKNYQGFTEEHYFILAQQENEIKRIKEQKDLELLQLQRLQKQHNLPITIIKENPVPFKQEIKKIKTNGRKIQKYTPDGILVNTFSGLTNAIRTDISENLSEGGLKFAINKKIEYRGHRWVYLDKELPDNTIQDIGDNNTTIRRIPIDFIAMLDIDNKYIINVFESQSEAAKSRHLSTTSSIYNSIKNNALCKGHRFKFFSKCTEEQKNKYLENNKLPENNRNFNSKKVKQINPITNEVMVIYNSFTELRSKLQIGSTKIKQVIKDDEIYKGYKWSY
jgi:prophage antirepressor-like protein